MIKHLKTEACWIVKWFSRLFNVLKNNSLSDNKVLIRQTAKHCFKISDNKGLHWLEKKTNIVRSKEESSEI